MLERSAQAPHTWGVEQTEFEVRKQILAVGPDLVLLQELPGMVPFVETHDMIRANPRSHNGNIATLVRHQLLADEGPDGPIVNVIDGCGLLVTFANGLTVANVHLAPGPGAVGERLEQMARVVESSPTPNILVIGDTNTRVSEIDAYASAGLTGRKPSTPTWDSRRNRFHPDVPEFSAYFTRWFATEAVEVLDVSVLRTPLEVDGHRFFLSDHFALTGAVTLGD
jgi:endonuclease/exonuclease/phosphatase family metal-dependent hydrolase